MEWSKRFPVRLTRKQKEAFLHELETELTARHFPIQRIDVRYLGIPNRLLATKCDNPKVIFLAHYDTPTIMPFWIGIFFKFWGHTRQISGGIILTVLIFIGADLLSRSTLSGAVGVYYAVLLVSLLSLFIPNPHNREDNTSGVIGLMALADWIKDKPDSTMKNWVY
jgi:hypothetical protein